MLLRGLRDAKFTHAHKKNFGFKFAGELLSDFYALAVFNFHKFNDSKARKFGPKARPYAVFISRQI